MIAEAKAIQDSEYKNIRQPISGFHMGFERKNCWRVAVRIGRRWFRSVETYTNEAAAKKAARAMVTPSKDMSE